MLDYRQLVAPRRHGEVLVVPDARSCAEFARENSARLNASQLQIAGFPLGELRSRTRARYVPETNKPVIVVGHQPDFIHPGVWAKNVFVARMAVALRGFAVNLVVDSDAPKRLSLRIPCSQDSRLAVREVRFGEVRPGCAFEQIQAISAAEREVTSAEVVQLLGERFADSLMPRFLEGLAESRPDDWVSQTTAGRRRVESQFGIALGDVRIRDAWWSPLAVHLLLDASGFARAYNVSIADYRTENGVRSPNRPIPDLVIEADRIELPFWFYFADKPRSRVFAAADQEHVTLCAQSEPIVTLSCKQIATSDDVVDLVRRECGWLLRPRALITTIWARLFLADLFVHGIGGAKYDRISDSIIAKYFGLSAPEIACVTATLYLDPNCSSKESTTSLEQEFRDAIWNPQRHLSSLPSSELAALLEQRTAAVQKSEGLAHSDPADRAGRRAAFQSIRRLSDQIHTLHPDLLDGLRNRLERSRWEMLNQRIACDREYFFALHAREHLERLLAALPESSDFV